MMRGLYANIIASSRQIAVAPSIVTTNLINYIDFSNASCYSGTGTKVYDLTDTLAYTIGGTSYNPSLAGGAMVFDGVNDYIISDENRNLLGSYSVGVWFSMLSYPSSNGVFWCCEDNSTDCYNYCISDNKGTEPEFRLRINSTNTNSGLLGTSINTWYYLFNTFNTSTNVVKTYLNGSLVATQSNTANVDVLAERLCMGARTLGGTSVGQDWFFHGWLAQIHFYEAEMSATDVTTNWNATKTQYGY